MLFLWVFFCYENLWLYYEHIFCFLFLYTYHHHHKQACFQNVSSFVSSKCIFLVIKRTLVRDFRDCLNFYIYVAGKNRVSRNGVLNYSLRLYNKFIFDRYISENWISIKIGMFLFSYKAQALDISEIAWIFMYSYFLVKKRW